MFELQTIYKLGSPYLKKWRILGYLNPDNGIGYTGKPWKEIKSKLPFAVRIHKFLQRDEDGAHHNHPWEWAISFILWGGYTEERINRETLEKETRTLNAPAINFIRHGDYHMVTALNGKPVTLFITGPRTSSWGFLVNGIHITWNKFLGIEDESQKENKSSSRYT